jgi:hypothetical protein
VRLAFIGVAAVAVVVVPTVVAMRIAEASAVYRVQDPWAAALRSDASAGVAKEAWSTSFRRDPPATLEVGYAPLGGMREPRLVTLAAIPVVVALVLVLVAPAAWPLALGLALLAPPMAVGTAFGSGALVVLAALAGAWWCAVRGSRVGAAVAVTVAVVAGAPGMSAFVPGGFWVSVALWIVGTGAGWWMGALVAAAVRASEHES